MRRVEGLSGLLVVLGCAAVLMLAAVDSAAADDHVALTGGFGRVLVDSATGRVSDLTLRNPDGSLPTRPLTGEPLGTSVVAADGTRYESRYGAARRVAVHRNRRGTIDSIDVEGVRLQRAPALTPVPVGNQVNSVIFSRDDKTAYASSFAQGVITPFDPVTGNAEPPIAVGGSPTGIVEAPNGHLFVSVCLAQCYAPVRATGVVPDPADFGNGRLVEIDPASRAVVASVPVGKLPQFPAITPDGRRVLVPNYGSDTVTVVDTEMKAAAGTIAVGPGPVTVAMAPDGKRAYVTNLGAWNQLTIHASPPGSDTITPIDVQTMAALAPIRVGDGPFGAAVTPDGSKLVVSVNRAHAVVLVDTASRAVSEPIDVSVYPTGGFPAGLAVSPDGATAYVTVLSTTSSSAARSVVPIDLRRGRALAPIPGAPKDSFVVPGRFGNGVAIAHSGGLLLSANWAGSTVSRYDLHPPSESAPVTEDWNLSIGERGELRWSIAQHWHGAFAGSDQAQPTIPLVFGAVSTVWYEPDKLLPRVRSTPASTSSVDYFQTLDDSDTWATYKLWSPYHLQSDLRLRVKGGYLTRFVSANGAVSRAGARFDRGDTFQVSAGTERRLTLEIASSDKRQTGYQLRASAPDRQMVDSLADFYGSLLNGGAIADQSNYWWGNEAAGPILAYEAFDSGMALSVGVPSAQPSSEHDYPALTAFRGYLETILKAIDPTGKNTFAYSASGCCQDSSLYTLLGLYQYTLQTGDTSLFARYEAVVARMLRYFTSRIAANGLVRSPNAESEYHDIMLFSTTQYYSTYQNAFVYQALRNIAELERALASSSRGAAAEQARAAAVDYDTSATALKAAINRVLWTPDSPHGPMYADWIDGDTGDKQFYFMGAAQYPAIAFGIASRAQARQILATADARLSELATNEQYSGTGTLVTLWPVPPQRIDYDLWPFGVYMNGGMLLRETYFEVMARARAGDANGAYERLRGFARGYRQTSWWGDNGATIAGTMEGGSGEPYLADMLAVPASLVQGILGINGTWDELSVRPALPRGWHQAQASVMYRGDVYCVSIHDDHVSRSTGACKRQQ